MSEMTTDNEGHKSMKPGLTKGLLHAIPAGIVLWAALGFVAWLVLR